LDNRQVRGAAAIEKNAVFLALPFRKFTFELLALWPEAQNLGIFNKRLQFFFGLLFIMKGRFNKFDHQGGTA
jgi:hypothetical protein